GPREVAEARARRRRAGLVLPDERAALRVVRVDVRSGRNEELAVLHHRHRPPAAAIVEPRRLPRALQLRQRVFGDLGERRVTRVAQISAHGGPFFGRGCQRVRLRADEHGGGGHGQSDDEKVLLHGGILYGTTYDAEPQSWQRSVLGK